MAQINTIVGDFPANTGKIIGAVAEARASGADIITFPEMAVCGYPPEDLLFKRHFIRENRRSLERIVKETAGITAIVGFVDSDDSANYNAAAIIHDGRLAGIYRKILLPNYGVFDEARYFRPGRECPVYLIGGIKTGVSICEDIWDGAGPAVAQAAHGAELLLNISASPYHYGKGKIREDMLRERAAANGVVTAYTNLVGGQDELVYDGNSLLISAGGEILRRGNQFSEDMVIADIAIDDTGSNHPAVKETPGFPSSWQHSAVTLREAPFTEKKPPLTPRRNSDIGFPAEVYAALVLGTRDYIRKNGFEKVLIGISGGIDSALVAAIAADALGAENVTGVAMPSRYSSQASHDDARQLAENLKIELLTISIEPAFKAHLEMLADAFAGTQPGIAEENLQARIRGNILMALSNKFGYMVLTTGNKSEIATGYTTLYGDMAGGFAVIKDVPKTMVYQLAEYCNASGNGERIPAVIISKPPSAELRPEQKDSDSLPPYDQLDPVLAAYIEDDMSVEEIIGMGFGKDTVQRASRLVDRSEYKRRQAPPGIKITPRAFGRDRRLPITNHYLE